MFAGILSALGTVGEFLKLLGFAMGWLHDEHEKQTGIDLQRGADAEAALSVETKVAQVAAHTVTQDDVDRALSKGGVF